MKKRIGVWCLILFLCLGLCACRSGEPEPVMPPSTQPQQETVPSASEIPDLPRRLPPGDLCWTAIRRTDSAGMQSAPGSRWSAQLYLFRDGTGRYLYTVLGAGSGPDRVDFTWLEDENGIHLQPKDPLVQLEAALSGELMVLQVQGEKLLSVGEVVLFMDEDPAQGQQWIESDGWGNWYLVRVQSGSNVWAAASSTYKGILSLGEEGFAALDLTEPDKTLSQQSDMAVTRVEGAMGGSSPNLSWHYRLSSPEEGGTDWQASIYGEVLYLRRADTEGLEYTFRRSPYPPLSKEVTDVMEAAPEDKALLVWPDGPVISDGDCWIWPGTDLAPGSMTARTVLLVSMEPVTVRILSAVPEEGEEETAASVLYEETLEANQARYLRLETDGSLTLEVTRPDGRTDRLTLLGGDSSAPWMYLG